MKDTLADAFPVELDRVRELAEAYSGIGQAGWIGLAVLEGVIARAEEAQRAGDVAAMIVSCQELRGCK